MSFCNKEYGYLAYRAILFFSELNKRVECVRKCENMSINAINAVNVNYQPQKIENKKDVSKYGIVDIEDQNTLKLQNIIEKVYYC